jgi:pyoverdine/dityrosine biosynthesis protein Dit1
MLEKKERFLQKKSSAEIEKAKDYTKVKNKNGEQVYLSVSHFVAEYEKLVMHNSKKC